MPHLPDVVALLRRFPFKTMLAAILACYVVVEQVPGRGTVIRFPKDGKELTGYKTEFYPLSAFPMYSTFAERVFYVYLTDAKDQPIRLRDIPATASVITKDYNKKRDDLKAKLKLPGKDAEMPLEFRQQAGRAALQNLMTNMSRDWFSQRPEERFHLVEGVIFQQHGEVKTTTTTVASLTFQEASQP